MTLGAPEVQTIPCEFVDWSDFHRDSLHDGEVAALYDQEMRYAIEQADGVFRVRRWSRGSGPYEVAAFSRELDACRELMLMLGDSGRSIHHLALLAAPAGIPTTESAMVLEQTEPGWAALSWDEGGERHRRTFRDSLVGHMDARIFAQTVGATIPELAAALADPEGAPLFTPQHPRHANPGRPRERTGPLACTRGC